MDLDEDLFVNLVLAFVWCEFVWETYLSIRQLNVYKTNNDIPEEFRGIITEESFEKARLYGIDKSKFKIIHELQGNILKTIILYNRWMSVVWSKSEKIATTLNYSGNEIFTSCIFLTIMCLYEFVMNMPFDIYSTFVLEEKHGFNKQTTGFYIKDKIKSLVLSIVLLLPIMSACIYIIMWGGDMFVMWLWLFSTFAILFLMTIFPTVIAPLFDKFTPLEQGPLRQGIEGLASKLNFPLTQIFIVEGSKRSAHSNAYFTGLINKRIVIFDTLLEKYDEDKKALIGCSDNEVIAVLGHELGHWSLWHIPKNLVIVEANLLLTFMAFAALFKYSLVYTALGFEEGNQPIIIGLIVILQFILAPYNALLSYFQMVWTRKFEYEADDFAVKLDYGPELKSALLKLTKDNLDYPIYDKLYSSWYHSHPTVSHRVENIDLKMKKM